MKYKLLIHHRTKTFDATGLMEGEAVLESNIMGNAGKFTFRLIRDGIIDFQEGSSVLFSIDGKMQFSGWVMTKTRTSEQIISVTAYDQLFYLSKNKDTYVYYDKSASQLIQMIASDYELPIGNIDNTGWQIPQRIEEGQTLLDIILSALEITKQSTGKEFFLYDDGGKLTLSSRESMRLPFLLSSNGEISDYAYTTDISRDTYNSVRIFQANRLETEHLAYADANEEKTELWGKLQYYQKASHLLPLGQLEEIAQTVLADKCRVKKQLVIENISGGMFLRAGNSVAVEIPDLAEISLKKVSLIEKCIHRFADNSHFASLQIRMEE